MLCPMLPDAFSARASPRRAVTRALLLPDEQEEEAQGDEGEGERRRESQRAGIGGEMTERGVQMGRTSGSECWRVRRRQLQQRHLRHTLPRHPPNTVRPDGGSRSSITCCHVRCRPVCDS